MSEQLIQKITQLQSVLDELQKRYHITATELANLKNKPNYEEQYKKTIENQRIELSNCQAQLNEHIKSQKDNEQNLKKLVLENQRLNDEIHHLKQKNKTAVEHAELIQNWLQRIDNNTL